MDGSDNIYVLGNFAVETDFDPGPGSYVLTTNSHTDSYLAKFSSDGDLQWARGWGGIDDCCQEAGLIYWETGFGLATSLSGLVYTTGMYSSENYNDVDLAPESPPCNEDADYHTPDDEYECFLIKFLPDGCW